VAEAHQTSEAHATAHASVVVGGGGSASEERICAEQPPTTMAHTSHV